MAGDPSRRWPAVGAATAAGDARLDQSDWARARVEYVLGRWEVDRWTYRQIGVVLGVSAERVRQLRWAGVQARRRPQDAAPADA